MTASLFSSSLLPEKHAASVQQQGNETMTSLDPFMTLVDAATALIDHGKMKQGDSKIPQDATTPPPDSDSETKQRDIPQNATPPPDSDDDSEVEVVAVSPASPGTPKVTNRTRKDLKVDNSSFQHNILPTKLSPLSFTRTLMKVLMDESLHDIITFLPDGDAFAILKPRTFAEVVMPKYFAIRTFSPFLRKLHRWGFERIMDKRTHDFDVFRHPLFIRGNFILCDKIKCIGRLVTSPVEESILTEAGINSKLMAMPTHQELEIRSFVERTSNPMMPSAPTSTTAEMLLQASRQSSLFQEAQSSFLQQTQLRQAGAQQALQQQVTDSAAVNHMLLTSLNKNREEEHRMKEELQRFTQEELLRQEVAKALQQKNQQILFASLNKSREEGLRITEELQRLTQEKSLRQNVANAIQQQQRQQQQQARLRELFTMPRGGSQANNSRLPMSPELRAALENQSGRGVDSLAVLRHFF